jgi:hypothetical protein
MSGEQAQAQSQTEGAPAARHGVFIPGLLLAIAVLSWTAFQTAQFLVERNNFTTAIASQDPQMAQSQKVRAALESIATRTARIAQGGNPNATIIVEELRKRGITINPDGPPVAPGQ